VVDLDDLEAAQALDKGGMLALVEAFPVHCEEGWRLGTEVASGTGRPEFDTIVFAGMGGSAVAGDIAAGLLAGELSVPCLVWRDYGLPAWAGKDALVICSSYSGETEETLSAFREALVRGCRLIGVTSGGTLERECRAAEVPVIPLPGGLPPRASLGYALLAVLSLFRAWGLGGPPEVEVREAVTALRRLADRLRLSVPQEENPAKSLAKKVSVSLPVLLAAGRHLGPVAYRWRTQLNENAKMAAYNCEFPELDHNEIVAWRRPFNVERPLALFLRDASEPKRLRKRVEITREILKAAGVPAEEVRGEGGPFSSALCLISFGDYVSVYASFARGLDPTPVAAIESLKAKMRDSDTGGEE